MKNKIILSFAVTLFGLSAFALGEKPSSSLQAKTITLVSEQGTSLRPQQSMDDCSCGCDGGGEGDCHLTKRNHGDAAAEGGMLD